MSKFLPRRWLWRGVLAAVTVLVGLGVAAAVIVLSRPRNVSHPDLQYTAPTTTVKPPTRKRARKAQSHFLWPWYGYTAARTRDFNAPSDLHPPLHVGWTYGGTALLEFPPSIYQRMMYLLDDSGFAKGVSLRTGKVIWSHRVGTLAAASPAIARKQGVVLMPVLSEHGSKPGGGRFVALSMKHHGRVVWSRADGPGSESSPIVHGHTVYYGDQGGYLYARDVRTGHLFWRYHASGPIKGGPALVGGILYFGDYAGRVYAVRASNGHQVWARSTSGAHFGLGSGQFYATPAVAYGRVYIGNTDGRVYAFGQRDGALAWATGTGAYVYSSAAVADPKGVGPTVFVGSYDDHMYAFNAQSGKVRWKHYAGGRISGSATVIGNVVYYSNLGAKSTTGLDVRNGKPVFHFADGAFTPVIADEQAIYLIGYSRVYQMLPGTRAAARARARRRQHHAKRKPTHAPVRRTKGHHRHKRTARRHTGKRTARHVRKRTGKRTVKHAKRHPPRRR